MDADPRTIEGTAPGVAARPRWLSVLDRALSLAVALFLFVLAIQLMKGGAKALAPTLQGSRLFDNAVATLGAGWLGAYLVLSGSPIAAVSLGLFSGGALNPLQTFTMLSGSRLGASFIVLLVGFIYAVRHRAQDRAGSVGMGVMALTLTAVVYLPGMLLGYAILRSGWIAGVDWHASTEAMALIEIVWGPALNAIREVVPAWLQLPLGLGIILLSFRFLDRVLPQIEADHMTDARRSRLTHPWTMFAIGCLVATLTLSVSVALTVLVPLVSRGYVRREDSIPYIMGANITTLADTLVAAMLTGNPIAVQIVLAEAIGVTIVSVALLLFARERLRAGVLALDGWVIATNRRLQVFVLALFVFPVALLTSGIWIGPIVR